MEYNENISKIKVIFLDFDGVINDYQTFNYVNEENVRILKRIIDETGAKVVVTSSNKYTFQREKSHKKIEDTIMYTNYIKKLNENGIEIFDFTPLVDKDREHEILQYLNLHPEVEQYLILDDDYIIQQCMNHEIYLDLQSGLREKHLIPAIKILNGELNFYHDCNQAQLNESVYERIERMNKIIEKLERNNSEEIER